MTPAMKSYEEKVHAQREPQPLTLGDLGKYFQDFRRTQL